MNTATQNGPYGPLDPDKTEIRILYVDGFTDGTPYGYETQCATGRLVHISLAEKHHIPFYALSYVWGDPAPVSAIILDSGAQIPIAHNLCEALEHITKYRFLPVNVPIWIDAACINQTDDLEKSSQVSQMASIYSTAQKTLIFLGPAHDDSDQIMDVMKHVGSKISKTGSFKYWNHQTTSLASEVHDQQKTTLHRMYNRMIGSLRRHRLHRRIQKVATRSDLETFQNLGSQPIMCVSWWARVWVLQELLLSQSPWFIYGSRIIEADHLESVLNFLNDIYIYQARMVNFGLVSKIRPSKLLDVLHGHEVILTPAIFLSGVKKRWSGSKIRWSLGYLLSVTISWDDLHAILRTSQPIDQIYGILSLVTMWPKGQAKILPDYSLSPVEVFARATVAVLETTLRPTFTYLRRATHPKIINELPSWTCDWTNDRKGYGQTPMQYEYNKTTSILPYEMTMDGKHLLTLHGSSYGLISGVGTKKHLFAAPNLDLSRGNTQDQQQFTQEVGVWLYDLFSPFWDDPEGYKEMRETSLQDECDVIELVVALDRYDREIFFALRADAEFKGSGSLLDGFQNYVPKLPPWSGMMVESLRKTLNSIRRSPVTEIGERLLKGLRNMWLRKPDLEDTLIKMDSTLLGFAQSTVLEGDLVVEFDLDQGIHFVIRPVEDNMYKLISMAWIPGLMRDPRAEGERKEFVLC